MESAGIVRQKTGSGEFMALAKIAAFCVMLVSTIDNDSF